MSKKLALVIQTLLLLGSFGKAYAETYDVYENGRHSGTISFPANQYPNVANRMRGSGVTIKPHPRPDAEARRKAAEQRMDQWRLENDRRRIAAQLQQDKWRRDFNRRHAAAQRGFEAWRAAR